MPSRIRVLVADHSTVIRRLVAEALHADPEFEVYAATDCQDAIAQIPHVRPDVVLLDLEIPTVEGIDAVHAIRSCDRSLPILMLCRSSEANGDRLFKAMARGAGDYLTKAIRIGHVDAAVKYFERHLPSKIRLLTRKNESAIQPDVARRDVATERHEVAKAVEIVVVGTSSGRWNELETFLSQLPDDLSVPVLVAHHMAPTLTQLIVQRLSAVCTLPIAEAVAGNPLEPGQVWLAPGEQTLTIADVHGQKYLATTLDQSLNASRSLIDSLFRSAVRHYRSAVVGVVVTGSSDDGRNGSRLILEAGGQVLVQDRVAATGFLPDSISVSSNAPQHFRSMEAIAHETIRLIKVGDPSDESALV